MKRMLIAGALALAAASQAVAADLPPVAPPPPRAPATYVPVVVPTYNWGGIYLGINGGYGFGQSSWADTNNPSAATSSGNFSTNGFLIGGTVGGNFQAGQAVFGIEADWDWANFKGSTNPNSGFCGNTVVGSAPPQFLDASSSCQTQADWLATVRGRIGYAFDRVLVFGTGGLAVANVETNLIGGTSGTPSPQNNIALGWTAGAGVEFAFAQNWTAKFEYLFVDLENVTCNTSACGADYTLTGGVVPNDTVKLYENIVRAGINFKFNPF